MARRRKRDFWDDVDEDIIAEGEEEAVDLDGDGIPDLLNERFKLTKCMPIKVIARILLLAAAVVVGLCGYVAYRYVSDRYADGVYSTSYFESNGFSAQYNDAVERLIRLLATVESEGTMSDERTAELISSIMDATGNFSFFVLDSDAHRVIVSSEDAEERIESSYHFLQIDNTGGTFEINCGVPTAGLDSSSWKSGMDQLAHPYNIYTAVDNNLTQKDVFYDAYIQYQKLSEYFEKAKIIGIAALAVFILLLIFSVVATGTRRGYSGIRLNWYDRILTEISVVMLAVVLGAIAFGWYYVSSHNMRYPTYIKAGLLFLLYVVLIRAYFSLVRRIKSGTFIRNSIIYKICHGINSVLRHLPGPLRVIIIIILLLALNGALVYALLYMRDITVKDIPVIFIVAPIVFVIELIGFIGAIFGVGEDETMRIPEEADEEEGEAEELQEALPDAQGEVPQIEPNAGPAPVQTGWDEGFKPDIPEEAIGYEDYSEKGATHERIRQRATDKTLILSDEERQRVLDSLGFTGRLTAAGNAAAGSASQAAGAVGAAAGAAAAGAAAAVSAPVPQVGEMEKDVPDNTVFIDTKEIRRWTQAGVDILPEGGSDAASQGGAATAPAGAGTAAAAAAAAADRADELGLVDFIQLNKDVRRQYKLRLQERNIGVTLRAPRDPIYLDIDKANAVKVLSILFDNVEKYAKSNERVIIEMYSQKGKMVYMMKNSIREDMKDQITVQMGAGLTEAKRIIQTEKGRLINSLDGDIYKVGILLDVAQEA